MSTTFDEALERYLLEPVQARREEVQQWILRHPRYDPRLVLPDTRGLGLQDRLHVLSRERPAALLNPRLHAELARALAEAGDLAGAERQRRLAGVAIAGLRASGTGREEDPIAVLRVQDEYDLPETDGHTAVSQQLSRTPDAAFDVVALDDGTVVWFELVWERQAWRRSGVLGPTTGSAAPPTDRAWEN